MIRRTVGLVVAFICSFALLASPASAVPNDQDVQWMVAAHQSNLAEIAAGTAASAKATTATVRDLGAMFVEMHTALDAELVAAAGQLGVALPSTPTAAQQQSLAAVEANSGAAFDSAWIAQQLQSHATSLANGQRELELGSDATVLGLARAAGPVVQSHYDSLQAAAGEYGIPSRVEAGTGGQSAGSNVPSLLVFGLIAIGALAIIASGGLVLARRR